MGISLNWEVVLSLVVWVIVSWLCWVRWWPRLWAWELARWNRDQAEIRRDPYQWSTGVEDEKPLPAMNARTRRIWWLVFSGICLLGPIFLLLGALLWLWHKALASPPAIHEEWG